MQSDGHLIWNISGAAEAGMLADTCRGRERRGAGDPDAHWPGYQARWRWDGDALWTLHRAERRDPVGRPPTRAIKEEPGQQDKTNDTGVVPPRLAVAAPHFAPSSSRLLPRRAMSNSTAKHPRVASHPIIAPQLRVPVPTQCNIRSPAPRLLLDGSLFCSLLRPSTLPLTHT